jgi:3-deoxy-D-arabino-heptulosonate 7-phosphate (DAHP) synthase
LGADALRMLTDVRTETGLPVVTEVMDTRRWISCRTRHAPGGRPQHAEFALLAELGRVRRPILLKSASRQR